MRKATLSSAVRRSPPLIFQLGRAMERRRIRGGTRLINILRRLGFLNRIACYQLGNGVEIDVPLFRTEENLWDEVDVRTYGTQIVDFFLDCANRLPKPVTFVDCGADIGLISLRVAAGGGLERIVAFEPNPQAFRYLDSNLRRLTIPAVAVAKAVSDFSGMGRLLTPDYDVSAHAMYLMRDPDGTVPVARVDEYELWKNARTLLLKIDVEGAELQVLHGARVTLEKIQAFGIVLEANFRVWERSGVEMMECARTISRLRPCRIFVCEQPELKLDIEKPLFTQIPPSICNLAFESKS